MKKLLLLALAAGAFSIANAQVKEGKIVYEQKIDLHRRIQDEQMKAMLPQFRSSKFELYFGDAQSLYKMQEAEPDITETTNQHSGMVMKFGGANSEYYKNFSTRQQVEKKELADKDYIVQDSIRSLTWKISGETKTILGYTCKKATAKTAKGSDVEAWYTEDILVASGPEVFSGLPGMILLIDINKGEIVYTALSLDKKVDRKELKMPAKGKKVTPEEFAKMQKDLYGNQNGPVRIVTN